MAQLFDIQKVTVGPRNLEAVVALAPSAPVMTSDDIEATAHVFDLLPGLMDHICLGDSSERFTEVAGNTELAHLLEHVTVELLAQTDVAGDISSGRTTQLDDRLYQITLACSDDVLVAGALSSAVWILQWAFSGAGDPKPDVAATVEGLVALVKSLDEKDEGSAESDLLGEKDVEPEPEPEPEPAVEEVPVPAPAPIEAAQDSEDEPVELAPEPEEVPEPAPESEPASESELESDEPGETCVMHPVPEPAPADDAPEPQLVIEEEPAPVEDEEPLPDAAEPEEEPVPVPEPEEPVEEPEAEPEPEPEPETEPEPEPAKPADPWDLIDAPRPHLVR